MSITCNSVPIFLVYIFFQEYDHPHVLLQNPQSQFTSMVRETGRAMTDQLMRIARQAYTAKYGERL